MPVESLNAEDAVLWCAETPGTQLQIGALCFFEAAPLRDRRGQLRHAAVCSHVDARLGALPRFRQRIATGFAGLAPPMWVDDTDFDVARHVKRVELPADGGSDALREWMDRILREPMDVAHPLWDIHLVEGVDSRITGHAADVETIAVVVRAHHVMADGIALLAAATLLLDDVPRRARNRHRDWSPEATPRTLDLTVRALAARTRRQAHVAVGVTRSVIDPRRFVSNARLASQVLGSIPRGSPAAAPRLPFTRPTGRHRAFAWDSIPMADVVAIKEWCGATVNDVVLAIVAGALSRYTADGGPFDPSVQDPRAIIPIGSHQSGVHELRNRFSITSVALPVGVDDPLERVRLIHSRMHEQGGSPSRSFVPHLFSIADFVPPPVLRAVIPRLLARQPLVNLAVSNIPGSRVPLFLCESRMLGLHPFIDVVGNVALIIGVLSYVDDLEVGITVDPDVVGDPRAIAAHLGAAATELAALVPSPRPGPLRGRSAEPT
ncbi:MAG: wax ester/triacylglycerol synthase family O-acyltransferase [Acidimicrobiia bacterium]